MTDSSIPKEISRRAEEIAESIRDVSFRSIDRMFFWLMLFQWFAGIAIAVLFTPYTWIGAQALVHEHVWASVFLGGLISVAPMLLVTYYPGRQLTRHVIAVSQALWGALLIHLSGGRIETHFHIFGSLAFVAFYRDWTVLVTMTVVVAADHAIRGIYFPLSVYGIMLESPYRWLEHAAWVICEDVVLLLSCHRGRLEVQQICIARAELEATNRVIENRVDTRTRQLRDTTNFFRAVLDSIHAQVSVIDRDGRIVEANRSWVSLNEKSVEFATNIGDNFISTCLHLAQSDTPGAAEVAEAMTSVLEDSQPRHVQQFCTDSTGETQCYQFNISPVIGHARAAAVIARINVTDQVAAERELKTASSHLARMSLLAQHTDNAVIILQPDGRVDAVNEGFERLYGYAASEIEGRRTEELLLGPESDPDTVAFMREKRQKGLGYDVELCKYRKNGEPVWVSIELRPIYSADGELQRFVSMARDITQRREREQSLQLLRKAIDSANDAMFIIRSDGGFADVNNTACRRLGYSRDELLELTLAEIEHTSKMNSWMDRWHAVHHGDTTELNGAYRTQDGSTFPVEVSAVPVTYEGQSYLCAFAQDVSERKQAEQEHERLNAALRNAARQAGMAEVAADVLHNVGNALNSINISIQLLRQHVKSRSIDSVARAADILFRQKDNLHEFLSNDEQGKVLPQLLHELTKRLKNEREQQGAEVSELERRIEHVKAVVASQRAFSHRHTMSESVLPSDVFEESLRMHTFSSNNFSVSVDTQFDEIEELFLEKHFVMQILINLIKNAQEAVLSAAVEKPLIKLTLRLEEDYVCFEVRDNGIGVAEENLIEIFGHGFTTKSAGHGFGLHSCANLAQEMGGALTVQSDGIGFGATFVLKLPVVRTPSAVAVR